jgi:hypothetical protein
MITPHGRAPLSASEPLRSQPGTMKARPFPDPLHPALAAGLVLLVALAAAGVSRAEDARDDVDLDALVNVPLPRRAYAPGEYLAYRIAWAGLPAGKASMSVVSGTSEDGRPVDWLVSITRSNRAISLVYPVKDRVVSQINRLTNLPERIDISQRHGRRSRVRTIFFDQARHQATTHWEGRDPVTMPIPPRVQDIVSCLYYFRDRADLGPGSTVTIDVNDGKRNWQLAVNVEGREHVVVPAGGFDVLRAEAEVRFEGVFLDQGQVRLWLTDDMRHVPVQVSVKIPIGWVFAQLTDMALPSLGQGPKPMPASAP